MAAVKHTHKYERAQVSGAKLWRCALGGKCTHYLPRHLENLIIGRDSICWNCEQEFTLNAANTIPDRPICAECSGAANIDDKIAQVLAGMKEKE